MSIADLYSSEKDKNLVSHFQNLLAIAQADGNITESEMNLLTKVGKRLGYNREQVELLSKETAKLQFAAPVDIESRNLRFARVMAMIWADGDLDEHELGLARRLAVGLGIPDEQIDKMIDKASAMFVKGASVDEVAEAL